ncbi:MAG: circularly permuted type 2 ATP-grasp protein, partial [Betaproteobacteria bacterium]|nr:circularly permuted type 2 ATP-grasp protein [Betaproteobacteria bacterium]
YVAQELVHLSQAPTWDRAHPRLLARAIGLRVFACATPEGYIVMPGGLTRVASAADARVISMQRGGSSKDTWVLASGPVSTFTLLRSSIGPADLVRAGSNLSSRVVENLFWLGRYSERCDATARLLRIALGRFGDNVPGDDDERARPVVLELLRRAGMLVGGATSDTELSTALRAAIVDESVPGLASAVRQLMRVASNLRERLSLDNWRTLNRLTQQLAQRRGRKTGFSDLLGELDFAITSFTTLSGYALDGMTRDPGWRFLSIGRRLERLQTLCATLKVTVSGPPDMDLTWLLRLSDSIITYRARYMARPEWLPVLDLLIRDEANPRSIAFQVHGLRDYAQRLVDRFGDFGDERFHGSLAFLLRLDPAADLRPGSERLLGWLEEWQQAASRHAEQLGLRFFSHVGESSAQTFAT